MEWKINFCGVIDGNSGLENRSVVKEMYVVIFCMLYDFLCIMHEVIMLDLQVMEWCGLLGERSD